MQDSVMSQVVAFPEVALPIRNVLNNKGFSQKLHDNIQQIISATYVVLATIQSNEILAVDQEKLKKMSIGFYSIYEVFSRVAEPVIMTLMIYGFILYAIDKNGKGLTRIKQGAYSFLGITLLPDAFELLRWIGHMIHDVVKGGF